MSDQFEDKDSANGERPEQGEGAGRDARPELDERGQQDRMKGGGSPFGDGPAPSGGCRGPSRLSWLYILVACALIAYLAFNMNAGSARRAKWTGLPRTSS